MIKRLNWDPEPIYFYVLFTCLVLEACTGVQNSWFPAYILVLLMAWTLTVVQNISFYSGSEHFLVTYWFSWHALGFRTFPAYVLVLGACTVVKISWFSAYILVLGACTVVQISWFPTYILVLEACTVVQNSWFPAYILVLEACTVVQNSWFPAYISILLTGVEVVKILQFI